MKKGGIAALVLGEGFVTHRALVFCKRAGFASFVMHRFCRLLAFRALVGCR